MSLILQGDTLIGTHAVTALPISISFWAKGDSGMGGEVLLQLGDGSAYIKLYIDESTEYVRTEIFDGTTSKDWGSSDYLLVDEWKHIAVVADTGGRSLYVNGVEATSGGSFSISPTGDLWIACDSDERNIALPLVISDLAVWDSALSDSQVANLYAGASPYQMASGLRHYWPFFCAGADLSYSSSYIDEVSVSVLSSQDASSVGTDQQPPVLYMRNRQMLPPPGYVAPWQRLAPFYSVTFILSSYDISEYVEPGSWSVKDTGGVELETMSFTMRTPPAAAPLEWRELEVWVDYGTVNQVCIFGGMIVKDTRSFSSAGVEVLHTCKAEGFKTLLSRSKPFVNSYKNQTVTAIIEDMLTDGERVSNPAFTVQATDETISFWTKELDESISKNIERMCQEYGWRWRVTWDKVIVVGPEGEDVAPFGVCQASQADYFMLFPVENVAYELDGAEIANSLYLVGGMATSDEQTDNFVGDGTTTIFSLAVHPIASITSIKVDGVTKSWGTIGYHSCSERDVLVHFAQGYVSFCTAPLNTKPIEVKYTYNFPYTYTTFFEPAQSQYHDVVLWELVEADWISDDTQAAVYCSTILTERAFSPERLTCDLRRAGLRAGQTCPVAFNDLGISAGSYMHVDSVGISQDQSRRLRFSVRLGPSDVRLTRTIGQTATVV